MKTQHVIIIGLALALALTIGILIGVLGGRGDSGGSGQEAPVYERESKMESATAEESDLEEDLMMVNDSGEKFYKNYTPSPRNKLTSIKGKALILSYSWDNGLRLRAYYDYYVFYPDGRFMAVGLDKSQLYILDVLVGQWKDDGDVISVKYYIKKPDLTKQEMDYAAIIDKQILLKGEHRDLANELSTVFRVAAKEGSLIGISGNCSVETVNVNDNSLFFKLATYGYSEFCESYEYVSETSLDEERLRYLNKEELDLMRNSIFARHRYRFKRADLQETFNTCNAFEYENTWARYANVDDLLTPLEKENIKKIQKMEINAPTGASR